MNYQIIDPTYILSVDQWTELDRRVEANNSDLKTELAKLIYELLTDNDKADYSVNSIKRNIITGLDDGTYEVHQNDQCVGTATVDGGILIPLPEPLYKTIALSVALKHPYAFTASVQSDEPIKLKYYG
nr:MAG TPA: hypothetical protein [Caudoviricetes sp.]